MRLKYFPLRLNNKSNHDINYYYLPGFVENIKNVLNLV